MIFRTLGEVEGSERDVDWEHGRSRRFLLESEGMGYSLADTTVLAGTSSPLQYRNHLVSCYVIAGTGFLEYDGQRRPIGPGTFYAMNEHDQSTLHAENDLRIISIFNPALTGKETHSFALGRPSSY